MFKVIGEYLKKLRERSGVTQQAVADRAGLTTAQYVSNVERGISPPSVDFLRIAVDLYDVDPEQLAFFISRAQHDYYMKELSQSKNSKKKPK